MRLQKRTITEIEELFGSSRVQNSKKWGIDVEIDHEDDTVEYWTNRRFEEELAKFMGIKEWRLKWWERRTGQYSSYIQRITVEWTDRPTKWWEFWK